MRHTHEKDMEIIPLKGPCHAILDPRAVRHNAESEHICNMKPHPVADPHPVLVPHPVPDLIPHPVPHPFPIRIWFCNRI
jgi:hypothetical protein